MFKQLPTGQEKNALVSFVRGQSFLPVLWAVSAQILHDECLLL